MHNLILRRLLYFAGLHICRVHNIHQGVHVSFQLFPEDAHGLNLCVLFPNNLPPREADRFSLECLHLSVDLAERIFCIVF
jgi:hypothetical protein